MLREALVRDGFRASRNAVDTSGFASNGVAVDGASKLYCQEADPSGGCVGLISWSDDTYILAWFPQR